METRNGSNGAEGRGDTAVRRLAHEVSSLQATLLGRLREELATDDPARFGAAAQRLAEEFGAITATAIAALSDDPVPAPDTGGSGRPSGDAAEGLPGMIADAPVRPHLGEAPEGDAEEMARRHASLFRPGQMQRRLDQLLETNNRYGHPFALVVFDVDRPGGPNGNGDGDESQGTALAVVGAALHDATRLVDEVFRLEEDGICVLAPNQTTIGGVQMAERLLRQLDELEAAGGLWVGVTAGVAACPEHGTDAGRMLREADEAMWRARAIGQPVGVGALQDR